MRSWSSRTASARALQSPRHRHLPMRQRRLSRPSPLLSGMGLLPLPEQSARPAAGSGRCAGGLWWENAALWGEMTTAGSEGDFQRPGDKQRSEIDQNKPFHPKKEEVVKSQFRTASSVKSHSHIVFNETSAGLSRQMTSIHSQLCAIDSIASLNEEIIIFVRECGI